jgi:hypothetical protein
MNLNQFCYERLFEVFDRRVVSYFFQHILKGKQRLILSFKEPKTVAFPAVSSS